MSGKSICKYLKSVRRAVAKANGIDLEIPECTFEGECKGTCPRCEEEVRLLERSLKARRMMAQKVAIAGVAMGLSLMGGTAIAQNITPADSVTCLDTVDVVYTMPRLEPDGMVRTIMWQNPVVVSRKVKNEDRERIAADGSVLYKVRYAEFPGGLRALDQYIEKNMTYPEDWGSEGRASGVVVVKFLVKADGSISRVKTLKGIHPLLDAEAKRLVANMQRWEPTTIYGRKVSRYYEISIHFLPR